MNRSSRGEKSLELKIQKYNNNKKENKRLPVLYGNIIKKSYDFKIARQLKKAVKNVMKQADVELL